MYLSRPLDYACLAEFLGYVYPDDLETVIELCPGEACLRSYGCLIVCPFLFFFFSLFLFIFFVVFVRMQHLVFTFNAVELLMNILSPRKKHVPNLKNVTLILTMIVKVPLFNFPVYFSFSLFLSGPILFPI